MVLGHGPTDTDTTDRKRTDWSICPSCQKGRADGPKTEFKDLVLDGLDMGLFHYPEMGKRRAVVRAGKILDAPAGRMSMAAHETLG